MLFFRQRQVIVSTLTDRFFLALGGCGGGGGDTPPNSNNQAAGQYADTEDALQTSRPCIEQVYAASASLTVAFQALKLQMEAMDEIVNVQYASGTDGYPDFAAEFNNGALFVMPVTYADNIITTHLPASEPLLSPLNYTRSSVDQSSCRAPGVPCSWRFRA